MPVPDVAAAVFALAAAVVVDFFKKNGFSTSCSGTSEVAVVAVRPAAVQLT